MNSNKNNIPNRRLDPARRRLRARLNGEWLFDTEDAYLLYEKGQHPIYAIPVNLLDPDLLTPTVQSNRNGDGQWWGIANSHKANVPVVRTWPIAPNDLPILHAYATVEFTAVDAWFEEDKEVFYKPRDPFRRVEILESSRTVRVEVDGVVVAESNHPRLVLENGMPEQWYLPRADVNWAHLQEAEMLTYCQYKGRARYWDVNVGADSYESLAWSYEETVVEATAMAGLVGFPRTNTAVKTFVNGLQLESTSYSPDWHSPSMAIS